MSDCDLPSTANRLMTALTKDAKITVPEINLDDKKFRLPWDKDSAIYQDVKSLSNEDLTTRKVDGDGAFDALMAGVSAHLDREYKAGRITGDDFTKAYIALSETAMSNATQFVINRDTSFWSVMLSQAQAMTAMVQLEVEKARLATIHLEVFKAKTDYAIAKTDLAVKSVEHCADQYNLDNILPKENTKLIKQIAGMELDNQTKAYNLSNILTTQFLGMEIDNLTKKYNLEDMLPAQLSNVLAETAIKEFTYTNMLPAQESLLKEQYEVQRAQTLDTRSDSQVVVGTLGKQKDLYQQQIESYKRNAELNAARIVSDAWITQKTLDEGLKAPNVLTNDSVQSVVTSILGKAGV